MPHKLLIPTSGTGSRLESVTQNLNKALIKIGSKTAIEHILNAHSPHIPLVITLGYLANQVKTFLDAHYPDRNIEYVTVDHYQGPGTSLGYSMLQAAPYLSCPFIFQACDTILTEPIPAPDFNWTGGYLLRKEQRQTAQRHYRTQSVDSDNLLLNINEPGHTSFNYAHIGITAVQDYSTWWKILSQLYQDQPHNQTLTDTHVISAMLSQGYQIKVIPYHHWYDIGNPSALSTTQQHFNHIHA